MKKHRLIFLGVGLLVLMLLAWRWQNTLGRDAPPITAATTPAAKSKEMASAATVQTAATSAATLTKEEQMRAVLAEYNHKNIEFYGKVVDQYSNPLPAVKVTGSVIYNSGSKSGVQESHTTTDAEGLFSFTGMKGRTFDYHLEKAGYETMPDRDAFDYTELVAKDKRHHPDPKNPVVLKMWKLQGAEPLVHFARKYYPLPADGTPVQIDLSTGKQVATGGDLVLAVNHIVLSRGALPKQQFDWRASAQITGGGLIESQQQLMYVAPETGYVPTMEIDMPATKADWTNTITRKFYVKTRGNLFGRIEVYLNANQRGYDPSYAMLQWWLNPKPGRRNLEVEADEPTPAAATRR